MQGRIALVSGIVIIISLSIFFTEGKTEENIQGLPCDYRNKNIDSSENLIDRISGKSKPVPQILEMSLTTVASQGEMLIQENGKKLVLPLIHTDVNGDIEGFVARVNVTQVYINPIDSTIEAIYTFPLPENAAVDSMILKVGDRRIKGVVKERQQAREIYEEAKREGKTASLLEQQRPNIFTQSVANILPGDTIVITISYLQQLRFKHGAFQFYFPMVVGPRYIPGQPIKSEKQGTEDPTNQVTDAHKITPPILPPDTRSGHDIALKIRIHKKFSTNELTSPSHCIIVRDEDSSTVISISPNDNIPNKDFMLNYTVAGDKISNVFLTHKKEAEDGFFQLIMIPKINISEEEIIPRELVFVVDNSGSMSGFPIEKCKELMKISLRGMRQDDLFRVIKFAGSTEILSSDPLEASDTNVKNALDFIDNMRGGGGTEMMKAINAIFDTPPLNGRKKIVLFMTDGYVGNEINIISTIRERLGESRVFSLGVGSSVNSYLLKGMAYAGRGDCMIIRQDGEAQKAIDEFYSMIDAPVVTGLSLVWKGTDIIDPQPAQLPDLFAGQPLVVTGKYGKAGKGVLTIEGKLSSGKSYFHRMDVSFPNKNGLNSSLPNIWARRKIEEIDLLGSKLFEDKSISDDSIKNSITKLGLQYKLMTQYTSFVAVEDAVRNKSGKWESVEQPVELPEGVSGNGQPSNRFAYSEMQRSLSVRKSLGGLKSGGSGGVGRKGVAGIGYGAGYGSGYGGSGSGNIDLLLNRLTGTPEFMKGATLQGARSKASVMYVVMKNIASLRYLYSKRVRENPELKGKITVKFAIDEYGKVIFAQVVESTMGDTTLESQIIAKIKNWIFEKIDKPGDVTEVIYPFVFSR